MAGASTDRSAVTSSSCDGFVSSPNNRFPSRRYVVSAPAGRSSRRNPYTCSSSSCWPSTSAVTSLLMRSSFGSFRRSATIWPKYSRSDADAANPRSMFTVIEISSMDSRANRP